MITGKILGKKYVINGISADTSGKVPHMSADTYYEVIRLIDGKLLFLPDHLDRLSHSLSGSGLAYPDSQKIMESLALLIEENPFREGNIRLILQQTNEDEPLLQCYFVPYFYPDPNMYTRGVRLAVYPHIRPNPGIKKWDDQFRNSVSKYILDHEVYEVALKNRQNQITEGSRSNIFFIDGAGSLISAPGNEILQGITRKYVLELAAGHGVRIEERTISADTLEDMVSVFISGTSPKVLPVKQIDDFIFDVNHPLLRQLMSQFEHLVLNSLQSL